MTVPRVIDTALDGPVLVEPSVHRDERGFLLETWSRPEWADAGIDLDFVQHNHSRSVAGTVRGIHFQHPPGQAKLIRCSRGRIFDVAVDLRPDSPDFGSWEGHYLDDQDHRQLFIPPGFGHGFCVVSEIADVAYQLSSAYDASLEAGVRWDDPQLGIEWPVSEPLVSQRDLDAPILEEANLPRA